MGSKVLAKVCEGERHLSEVTCLLFHKDSLYSGGDDGKVKVWSTDLKLIKETDVHPVSVNSIASSDDTLYTCSNDGTIKSWCLDSLEPKKTLTESDRETLQLLFYDGKLYSGDDKGNVQVWQNGELVGSYEVAEEVYGLTVSDSLLFTVRHLDVSVIDMKPGGKQYTYLQSMKGRSPIIKVGKYVSFMDREGKILNINEISKESKFKSMWSVQAHELIVNAMSSSEKPQLSVFTGGYDKVVKRWDVVSQKLTGSAMSETVINAMATDQHGNVYVAGSFGYLVKFGFE